MAEIEDCGWCSQLLDCNAYINNDEFKRLVGKLLCNINTNTDPENLVDTELVLLCDPSTGARVYVRYQFDESGTVTSITAFNIDGTPYVGDIDALVSCDDAENYATEYAICDNGTQKIARVCWAGCTPATATYFLIDRTATTAPADFGLVTYGSCAENTEFPAAALASDNFANPTTTNVMAMDMLWDGATWDRAPGNSTDGQLVNLGANNDVTTKETPDATATYASDWDDSAAYEASSVTKATPGVFYGIAGYNSGPAQFIQIFNSATVPADTAVPIITFKVAADANFSWDAGRFGKFFSAGISWSNSTTGPIKTIGAADIFANVSYK